MNPGLYDDEAPSLLAIFTVFFVLALTAVALRFIARRISHMPLWWDDWLIFLACVIITANYVFLNKTIQDGEGKHAATLPPEEIREYLMWVYATELSYPLVVTCVKCSILCLYLRLFYVNKTFVKLVYGSLAFVVVWGTAVVLSTIFQCLPVQAEWDKTIVNAKCINLRNWLIGFNVPNIGVDFVIILMPMPLVWKLSLSLLRRVGLCAIFLLAFIASIISIARVVESSRIDVTDVTWGYINTCILSIIEGNVGVIVACLPVLAPLIQLLCEGCRGILTLGSYSTQVSPCNGGSNTLDESSRRSKISPTGDIIIFSRLYDKQDENGLKVSEEGLKTATVNSNTKLEDVTSQ